MTSVLLPEIEYVDRATETIRYLEHGWPTDLCRWHSHPEYELHLVLCTYGTAFICNGSQTSSAVLTNIADLSSD